MVISIPWEVYMNGSAPTVLQCEICQPKKVSLKEYVSLQCEAILNPMRFGLPSFTTEDGSAPTKQQCLSWWFASDNSAQFRMHYTYDPEEVFS